MAYAVKAGIEGKFNYLICPECLRPKDRLSRHLEGAHAYGGPVNRPAKVAALKRMRDVSYFSIYPTVVTICNVPFV